MPIWFHLGWRRDRDGDAASLAELKALKDGDRVAVTIDTTDWPYKALLVRGVASVTRVDGITSEYQQSAIRYFGQEQGTVRVSQFPTDMQMWRIAVRPDEVAILDFESVLPSVRSA